MSEKPIAERLQVKGDRRLAVVNAPASLDKKIGAPRAPAKSADVVLLFVASLSELRKKLPATLSSLKDTAIFWLAYPKLTSKLAGDLNRDVIRELAPDHGLDTVSQIAIDADWSALRLKRVG
jgi:hypothetical protein